jgi:hypothetical protein
MSVETTNFHGGKQDRSSADIVVVQSKNLAGLCDLFGAGSVCREYVQVRCSA